MGRFGVHEWERKLQYRSDRRSLEHRHEPWLWDSDTDGDDQEDVDPSSSNRDCSIKPRNLKQGVPKLAWNGDEEAMGEERSKGKQVKNKKEAPKDLEGKSEHQDKHIDSLSKLDRAERQRRQRRSMEKKLKHHFSETSSKRAKNADKSKHKSPPFLPYGWANKGVPVENMKT